ncbi:MAG: diversity-generating retroelement protein Avd [Chloroflexota bacterium]
MNESPLYVRTYDLLLWLIPQVQKFPRIHRFGLAERIQRLGLDFQDSLTAAGKSRGQERRALLRRADVQLEQMRTWLRMAQELQLLSLRQYEHAARLTNEVGRLLGAWIKQLDQGTG